MADSFPSITDKVRAIVEAQHMFFVASAPLSADGHINLSPKGTDTFRILSPNRVAYLDMTGSGNETSAHLLENGRITFMFCTFDGPPDIVRLFGRGQTVLPGDPAWDDLADHFSPAFGQRQIIAAEIVEVRTSCGYGVPLYEFVEDRDQMARWCEAKGADGLVAYRQDKNLTSLDGLPTALAARKEQFGK